MVYAYRDCTLVGTESFLSRMWQKTRDQFVTINYLWCVDMYHRGKKYEHERERYLADPQNLIAYNKKYSEVERKFEIGTTFGDKFYDALLGPNRPTEAAAIRAIALGYVVSINKKFPPPPR